MPKRSPVLLIHGGAGSQKPSAPQFETRFLSLQTILNTVYPELKKGLPAIEAAVWAVELLENDPLYNAGYGSKVQSDGHIRLSASVMDGANRRFAGCVNVERVKNPIRLARLLLNEDDRVLAEKGGEMYARLKGLEFASPMTPARRAQFKEWKLQHLQQKASEQQALKAKFRPKTSPSSSPRQKRLQESRPNNKIGGKTGTVGAVVLDRNGCLAASTSTGGRGYEHPHRVSDTPTAAGNFANRVCAVSATGVGERIVEFAVASTLAAWVEAGLPLEKASQKLARQAKQEHGDFGWIALDRNGRIVADTVTEHLIWAAANKSGLEINP